MDTTVTAATADFERAVMAQERADRKIDLHPSHAAVGAWLTWQARSVDPDLRAVAAAALKVYDALAAARGYTDVNPNPENIARRNALRDLANDITEDLEPAAVAWATSPGVLRGYRA